MSGAPTLHVTWEEFAAIVPNDSGSGTYGRILRTRLETWAIHRGGLQALQALERYAGLPLLHPHRPEDLPAESVSYEDLESPIEDLKEGVEAIVDEDLEGSFGARSLPLVAWTELPQHGGGAK